MVSQAARSAHSRIGSRARGAPAGEALESRWSALHRGDREPFPDAIHVVRKGTSNAALRQLLAAEGSATRIATTLQRAWSAFHAGRFPAAIQLGSSVGAFGASVANKAAAVYSLSARLGEDKIVSLLEEATQRGEAVINLLPRDANIHYTLALVLGRYSQRISILRALAQGMAERVRGHLERALELEPLHAEAHIAFGLFHAEIIGKLGSLAANLAYHVTPQAALQHFERALELTPDSPIALLEYAHGLLLIDAEAHRVKARELYRRAAACHPADAMERLDRERARRELAAL